MNELRTFRLILTMLDHPLRMRCIGLIALAIAAVVLEVFSAFGVLWLIGLLHDPASVSKLPFIGAWSRSFCCDSDRILLWLCLAVALFYLLKNLFLLVQSYCQLSVPYAASVQVSARLLDYYLRMPYALHFHRNSAELVRNVMTSVDVVFRMAMISIVGIISDAFVVVALVLILLAASTFEALLAVASLGLLVAVMLRMTQRVMSAWGEEVQDRSTAVLKIVGQSLSGAKEVQVRGSQGFFVSRYQQERHALSRVLLHKETVGGMPRLLLESALVLVLTALIALAVVRTEYRGEFVPLLGLYAYAGFRLLPAVGRMAVNLQNVRFGAPAVVDLQKDMAACGLLPNNEHSSGRLDVHHEIKLERLSYTYPSSTVPALRDVDLVIRRGETIGIAGPTGSGKSTLVDILLGLLEPGKGRVLVDGVDTRSDIRGWQRSIGYVSQTPFLLDDTLRRNVAFGIEDDRIDEPAVAEAARLAQLEEVYRGHPEGLDLMVGERGVRLSGGQRQRIVIARALYGRPAVLVFDEATSALDNTTESLVSQAIHSLGGDRTLVMVAHRLSTIRACDRIVFMKDGCIADVGTYDELIATVPEFAIMAKASDGTCGEMV